MEREPIMFEHTTTTDDAATDAPPAAMTFGNASHRGRVRRANEDDHVSAPDLGFFVVADGVGGAPGGAVAARLATIGMVYALRSSGATAPVSDASGEEEESPIESHGPRLVAAAHQAHRFIIDHAARSGVRGAATTMAALWVIGARALVANTGDSRVYRLAAGGLEQLTRDHTVLQEHIDEVGPPSERMVPMMENVVTQVLGGRHSRLPVVRVVELPIRRREVLLLCTDGLYKMLRDDEIASILAHSRSAQDAASTLVERANDAGGHDNITAIVVHVEPPDSAQPVA